MKQKNLDISIPEEERLIDTWIKSERNRKILRRKLIDGITFERLAEEMEMSVRGVQYVVEQGLEELKVHQNR
ncbi:MAG: hypothetical protein IKW45_05280 [Clostridia bacterium]|nr:hypothetical protein [Clostridia bacterium]